MPLCVNLPLLVTCNTFVRSFPVIHLLFITDIKRWHFDQSCRHSLFTPIPLVFYDNLAHLNFRVRKKTSVYLQHEYENRYMCPKEGHTLQLGPTNECFLNASSEMYSVQIHPSQIDDLYIVRPLLFSLSCALVR